MMVSSLESRRLSGLDARWFSSLPSGMSSGTELSLACDNRVRGVRDRLFELSVPDLLRSVSEAEM